jgi:hypothetical protein
VAKNLFDWLKSQTLDRTNLDEKVSRGFNTAKANLSAGAENVGQSFNQFFSQPKQSAQTLGNNVSSFLTKPLVQGRPSIMQAAQMTAPTVAKDFGNLYRNSFLPQPVGQMVGNTAQNIGNSMVNTGSGAFKIATGRPVQGAGQMIKGVSQMATARMPLSMGSNILSQVGTDQSKRLFTGVQRGMSLDQTMSPNTQENKWIKGNLPVVGEFAIDPLTTAGNMYGFTQNTFNKKLFEATNKLIPSAYSSVGKWFTTTMARGGVEDIILGLDQLPEKAEEQIPYLLSRFGEGAVSELFGQSVNLAGKKVVDTKAAQATLQQLSKFTKWLNEPVLTKTLIDREGGLNRFTKVPRWKSLATEINTTLADKMPVGATVKDIRAGEPKPQSTVGGVDPFKNPVEKPQMDSFKQEFEDLNRVIEATYGKLPENKMQDIRNLIRDGGTDADIKDYLKKPEGSLDRFTTKKSGMDEIMGPVTQEPPRIKIAQEPPLPVEPMELKPQTQPKYDIMDRIRKGQQLTGPAIPLESKVKPVRIAGTEKPGSFTDRVMQASTKQQVEAVVADGSKKLDVITKDFENKGIEFAKVVDDLENGVVTRETRALKQWFDLFATKADQTMPFKNRLQNYFHRTGEAKLNRILEEGVKPDTFGDTLLTPSFYNKRSGSLTEYVKDPRVLKAYMIESLRNAAATPAQKQDIKLAQEIVEEYAKTGTAKTTKNLLRGAPFIKPIDVVAKIQKVAKNTIPEDKVIYDGKSKAPIVEGASETFKSPIDESMDAGTQFHNAFGKPFRDAELRAEELIKKLSKKDMTTKEYNQEVGRIKREQMSGAAFIFKNNVENAEFKQEWMKNLANRLFDEYIGDGIRKASITEKLLGQVRVFAGRGALGLNVSTAINNILEVKRAWSSVSTKSFMEGTRRALKGEDLVGKYGINSKTSTALERNSFRDNLEKFDKGLFYLFDKSEALKDNILLGSLEAQGKSKGMSGKELTDFVIQKFDKLAIKYGTGQDIGLYRSPLMKTIFQFGQYPIKDAVLFGEKLVSGIKGDKGDAKYVAKYAIASIVQMAILKAVIGKIGFGDQTNTPIDLINNIREGEIPTTPLVQALVLQMQDVVDGISGNKLSEYDQEQRNKQKNRSLATAGIPAVNQAWFKTGQTIKNQQKGYQETFSGNVANPVSGDAFNIGRSLLLGPSYDKYRQEYGDRRKKLTDEKQSTGLDAGNSYIFKQLPSREEQRAFYDNQIAETAKDQELSNIKIDMEKSDAPTGKFVISDKTPRDKKRSMGYINKKIEEGFELTPEEAEFKYLDKYNSMPTKTKYELMKKDEEAYKIARDIYKDDNMSQDEKVGLYKKLATSDEEIEYFNVASDNDDLQQMFVEEQMTAMDPEDRDEFLLRSRTLVNGKMMLTDTIVNKMKKDGVLSTAEAEALKKISFVKDNDYDGDDAVKMGDNIYKPVVGKAGSGYSSGFGTGKTLKISMPKMPASRSTASNFSIKIPAGNSSNTVKITRPNLQKRKKWRSIKLKY